MHVVGGRVHVRSGVFALHRVVVDPAIAERAVQRFDVVRAQRRHRRLHLGLRLLDGVFERNVGDKRRIEIVVVQLIDAENARAKLQVPMKRRQVLAHAVDERGVDRGGHVRTIERGGEGRVVVPRLARNIADCTSALMVAPNVRLNFCRLRRMPPSPSGDPRGRRARACRRERRRRRAASRSPSDRVTVGHGNSALRKMLAVLPLAAAIGTVRAISASSVALRVCAFRRSTSRR